MPRRGNSSPSVKLRVTLSAQSMAFLAQLAARGIYGRNEADVAARFIDERLQTLAPPASQPSLKPSPSFLRSRRPKASKRP